MAKRSLNICLWCANSESDVCIEKCREEGKYRYLVPEPLPSWEQPPELPLYREMLDVSPYAVRAVIWLHAWYQDGRNRGGDI